MGREAGGQRGGWGSRGESEAYHETGNLVSSKIQCEVPSMLLERELCSLIIFTCLDP